MWSLVQAVPRTGNGRYQQISSGGRVGERVVSVRIGIKGSSHHAEKVWVPTAPTNPPVRHRFMKKGKDKGRLRKERGSICSQDSKALIETLIFIYSLIQNIFIKDLLCEAPRA